MNRMDLDAWEDRQAAKRRQSKATGAEVDVVNFRTAGGEVTFQTKLGAARNALALLSDIPDLVELIDNAAVVRAAAKIKHISAEGINAWTRLVIDAERKAWARIQAMDDQLAKHKRAKGSTLQTLSDIDESLTKQKVHEWSQLAKIAVDQLDEMERVANEADRLLTRRELLALGKDPPQPRRQSDDDRQIIQHVQEQAATTGFVGDSITVDDDAKIEHVDGGAWVQGWLWYDNPLLRDDTEDDVEVDDVDKA